MYLHPLTASLPAAEREALIKCSELRHYKRNDTLLNAGESTDQIYCVASGLLRVVTPARDQQGTEVTTEFVARNDFFFDLSIRDDRYQSMHTLVAALPSAVYFVPIATMRGLCARHPEVALGLLGLAMKRMGMLRTQMRRISSLSPEAVVQRVMHQLADLAPSSAGGFDKRISQAVIASYAGLSREVVNKTMRGMENRGLMRRDEEALYLTEGMAMTDFGSLQDIGMPPQTLRAA
ncbi:MULTISPECIES: Crp/Fnr family transcriptional regulator [Variovorax]|jgi:CRP/FNR family transcriptional regulator, cyclic AMP receptor protein|nr:MULTISPECIES: Crp/Fnr family transcriptional regulator [Variovorax]MBN8757680.1 Crp/Fnr family transcriptional regulator [Variovorax sp.]UKI11220.1 Crp/Fnr family transcriptional regulator [Variovorax paradoxus]